MCIMGKENRKYYCHKLTILSRVYRLLWANLGIQVSFIELCPWEDAFLAG